MHRSLWERLKHSLSGGTRPRVTRSGIGYSVLVSVVGAVAFLSANNLVFLVLAALLATLLLSGFASRLSLAGLELDFVFPDHVSARRKVQAGMKLVNHKRWMPSFSLHVSGAPASVYSEELYFPILPGGATVFETVEVQFARRGIHTENGFVLRSRFPFGFAERTVSVTLRREVLVYPCLDPQPWFESVIGRLQGELEEHARGRGYDFYRIRPYEVGESARHVDWKATAHTGQLQVREFAREQEPMVEVFLDLCVPDENRSWFEQAVDCCAFVCWHMSVRGARVRLRTQEFDLAAPTEGDIYTILKYLALVEPKSARRVVGPDREDSIQVVFSVSPKRFVDAGWYNAHLLDLGAWSAASTGSGPDHSSLSRAGS
jgi:uncharacterized protein (DUF58 family)